MVAHVGSRGLSVRRVREEHVDRMRKMQPKKKEACQARGVARAQMGGPGKLMHAQGLACKCFSQRDWASAGQIQYWRGKRSFVVA